MTAETNKETVRKLYEDCINPGRLDLLPGLIADDFIGTQGERGPTGFTATITGLRTGFPDIHFTLEDLIAEADRVTVRWSWHGTHGGSFRGLAPTGKQLTNTGIAIYQLVNHKIVRTWLESDRLGALQQIGAIPATAAPASPPASQHP